MNFFNKQETKALGIIFALLLVISVPNFALSIKRARDTTRKADMGGVVNAVQAFHEAFGFYPFNSPEGKIIACLTPGTEPVYDENDGRITNFVPCEWGESAIYQDSSPVPDDPQRTLGASYLYLSTTRHFQVFASLEAKDDDEYKEKIAARNLNCGERTCNSGRSHGNTPLDKSLEEYEYELYAK